MKKKTISCKKRKNRWNLAETMTDADYADDQTLLANIPVPD